MFAHIGRQAIYGRSYTVAGYELLYRNGSRGNTAIFLDGDAATQSLLSDAVRVFGFQELTGGLPAYVNFTRDLILSGAARMAAPRDIIVEVPAEAYVDGALADSLARLKSEGYRLSLDGYARPAGGSRFDRLLGMFDVIRLDIARSDPQQIAALVERLRDGKFQLLAERVETEADFDLALEMKFSLFQGYFFEKPVCLSRQIPFSSTPYAELLRELLRDDPHFSVCAQIVADDPILTQAFLRQIAQINGPVDDPQREVRRGMVSVGTDGLRRWAGLTLLRQGNVTGKDELPRRAYQRGLFIQGLAEGSDTRIQPGQGFFLGLASLLDRTIGVGTAELAEGVDMDPEMEAALRGRAENAWSRLLQFAAIYEMGNERLILPDIALRLSPRDTAALYTRCAAEADEAFPRMDRTVLRAL